MLLDISKKILTYSISRYCHRSFRTTSNKSSVYFIWNYWRFINNDVKELNFICPCLHIQHDRGMPMNYACFSYNFNLYCLRLLNNLTSEKFLQDKSRSTYFLPRHGYSSFQSAMLQGWSNREVNIKC